MHELPARGPLRRQSETELRLDLHGYDVHTAVELAIACAAAAWEHGFERLTILHGARDFSSPQDVQISGRGAIKWAIRSALDNGEFDGWALPPRRGDHRRGSRTSETSIELRPNPDPHADAEWPTIPQPEHW
jgi:hypothetical protein